MVKREGRKALRQEHSMWVRHDQRKCASLRKGYKSNETRARDKGEKFEVAD